MQNEDLKSVYEQFRHTPLCIQCGNAVRSKFSVFKNEDGYKIVCYKCNHEQQFFKPPFMKKGDTPKR